MEEKFKSFREFGEYFINEERKKRELQLGKILKGSLNQFPSGQFKAVNPKIEYISLIKPTVKEGEPVNYLYIIIGCKKNEKFFHETFTLRENGTIYFHKENLGFLKKSNLSELEIYDEILDILKTINIDFFHPISDKLLPPGEFLLERDGGEEKKLESKKEKRGTYFSRTTSVFYTTT